MAPKKRKAGAAPKARARSTIERSVLTEWKPPPASSEVCGACLLPLEPEADVGRLDSCAHAFHFACAERWSQTENSCPQCKLRFFWLARYAPAGARCSLDRVQHRDQEGEEEEGFETIQACEVCKEVGDEAALLLCDGMHGTCNSAYHYACAGLSAVPRGAWFCPDCLERGFDVDSRGRRGQRRWAQSTPGEPEGSSGAGTGAVPASASAAAPAAAAGQRPAPRPAAEEAAAATACEPAARSSRAVALADEPAPAPQAPQAGPVHPFDPPRAVRAGPPPPAAGAPRPRPSRPGALPPHLRLGALTCVTPLVDLPAFRAPAAGGQPSGAAAGAAAASSGRSGGGGLFASFVSRRRAQRGEGAEKAEAATSFIKLNPSYEEDFMGK